jgi:hypothetical protein
VPNFRGRGGGGTHEQQIAYDYESILSDLKAVFGIEIKLETNLGTITPVSLPKGTTRLNQALLRQKMIEAQDDPERRMGNQVIVAMPGTFGVFKEIDPKLMSTEMGSRLEGHAKLKNIVIDLRK